jgi:D-3-phosphoglycerate dehydrogenase / 2-oxoglutarate reductase
MSNFNVLLTCPPMIKQISRYEKQLKTHGFKITIPDFQQVMTENQLCEIIGNYDGWIIGDDPATRKVFQKGVKGNLKACVKWGVGTDNVDFKACKELGIPICNTPKMFGEEVSDIAIGYLLCLSRKLHIINTSVVNGNWIKPCGETLTNKKVCVIGFGDIGKCVVRKLQAFNMDIWVSDPLYLHEDHIGISIDLLENCLKNANYVIVCCPLNKHTFHLLNKKNIRLCKKGVRLINVGRGPIVCEKDVIELLENGFVDSVGFDVFEKEPLSEGNGLRDFKQNIFGTHNASNTLEAVDKVSYNVLDMLAKFMSL